MSGHISQAEVLAVFVKYDLRGDGLISMEDLRQLLLRLGLQQEVMEAFFAAAGRGTDGLVRYADFLAWAFGGAGGPQGGGCAIEHTEERAITLNQLREVARIVRERCLKEEWTSTALDSPPVYLKPEQVNLYDLARWLIKPATRARRCSYVELVADGPQRPQWFVSHWWGEPVLRFVLCVAQHSADRGLGEACAYWVCAYANNQWALSSAVTCDPAESSFRRAMDLADGTLSVLDSDAVGLTRVWCVYEVYISLTAGRPGFAYDMYTAIDDAQAVGYTDGPAHADELAGAAYEWEHKGGVHAHKATREGVFPIDVAKAALGIRVQDAKASEEADRRHILNAIAGRPSPDLDLAPPRDDPGYDGLNAALRWRLAMAMYPSADAKGLLDDLGLRDIAEPEGEEWQRRAAQLYNDLALTFMAQARYGAALDRWSKARAIEIQIFGEQHPDVAKTQSNMASVLERQGELSQAMELDEKALAIQIPCLGEQHPDVAVTYSTMAIVRERQGEYVQAMALHEKTLAIQILTSGEQHPNVAKTYYRMAFVLQRLGDYCRAMGFHEKALAIQIPVLGEQHPDVAKTYGNMANVLKEQGELDRAMELQEKALAVRIRALGEQHPDVARTYNRMAVVLEAQGQLGRAMELYGKSLAIWSPVLGEQHPDVAKIHNNMASVLERKGELGQAMALHERALAIRISAFGEQHPHVAATFHNMAGVLERQGKLVRALELLEKALAIRMNSFGEQHPDVVKTRRRMAALLEAQGEIASVGL